MGCAHAQISPLSGITQPATAMRRNLHAHSQVHTSPQVSHICPDNSQAWGLPGPAYSQRKVLVQVIETILAPHSASSLTHAQRHCAVTSISQLGRLCTEGERGQALPDCARGQRKATWAVGFQRRQWGAQARRSPGRGRDGSLPALSCPPRRALGSRSRDTATGFPG